MAPIDGHNGSPRRQRIRTGPGRSLLLLVWLGATAHALSPHEVALLINEESPASLEVANHYAAARNIPPANRVYLRLPPQVLAPAGELTPAQFLEHIWTPAREALREAGVDGHILAWVYSVDFPYRIRTQPAISLHGMTLLRGEVPPQEIIDPARYLSPYYAGPDEAGGPQLPTRSLSLRHFQTLDGIPLPSFSLGHIRSRGLHPEHVLENIERSVAADRSSPTGTVLFVVNSDIRSTARAWQFDGAAAELRALGRPADVVEAFPQRHPGLMGLMLGEQHIPFLGRTPLLPGALADHLTSHAANFDNRFQGKSSGWIRHGATATAGTVTEPYALWPKFPHARLHAHYAAGATVIESYLQAVRCPLQLYLMGDPLCAPFAPDLRLSLTATPRREPAEILLASQLDGAPRGARIEYTLYLNDRIELRHLPLAPRRLSAATLPDGVHRLRLVAEIDAPLRHAAVAETTVVLNRQGRAVRLQEDGTSGALWVDRDTHLSFEADGDPVRVSLHSGHRRLATAEGDSTVLSFNPRRIGTGPNPVQVVAEYADGMRVAGEEVLLVVREPNQPVVHVHVDPEAAGIRATARVASDAQHIEAAWFRRLDPVGAAAGFQTRKGRISVGEQGFVLHADEQVAVCSERRPPRKDPPREVRVDLLVPPLGHEALAGIAFNLRNEQTFDFFGLHAASSAWIFGSLQRGRLEIHHAVGARLESSRWMNLHLRQTPQGLEGLVDGDVLCRHAKASMQRAEIGVFARHLAPTFRNWMETPVTLAGVDVDHATATVRAASHAPLAFVAWDGFRFGWAPLPDDAAASDPPPPR